jgi:deoxyribodipyrimidine photo-lyase
VANNPANWQWVAGSGSDAVPFFRIFNPMLQGEKFDPTGNYVRRWVPELAKLPSSVLYQPWTATLEQLSAAEIRLGKTYPLPIVVTLTLDRERSITGEPSYAGDLRPVLPIKLVAYSGTW